MGKNLHGAALERLMKTIPQTETKKLKIWRRPLRPCCWVTPVMLLRKREERRRAWLLGDEESRAVSDVGEWRSEEGEVAFHYTRFAIELYWPYAFQLSFLSLSHIVQHLSLQVRSPLSWYL